MTFYFCIPLKSKQTSSDWQIVESLFNKTIKSIYNQIADDYKILVACHEKPEIHMKVDSRIEFLLADYAPPKKMDKSIDSKVQEHSRMLDKSAKMDLLARRVKEYGGGYLMFMDADDIVSNRLVEYVQNDNYAYGYVVKRGYEYNYKSSKIKYEFWFNRICGSSHILRLSESDLPSDEDIKNRSGVLMKLMWRGHYYAEENSRKLHRPLKVLPFFACMYVINTSQNDSQTFGNIGWKRKILRKTMPEFSLSNKIKREFALD